MCQDDSTYHEIFKDVTRKFQGCFKDVPRKFQGFFKRVLMVFPKLESVLGSFKGVSWIFQRSSNGVSRMSQVFVVVVA